eukprot:TRINITY_DN2539_c0_g1_i3.p1 TRINITY_DN2539_c0_g1~~TRINITY_DN2539_c0_g1_i3.p1  ORF type:complete len:577 (+),score=162.69 TRINITY_DN2539_c0_g1_i3:65-1795(+)
MPYTIFVASDVFHRKVNLELEFPFAPTLADLTRQAEQAFTAEQNAQRPGAATPPFEIVKFHVVDEATDEWVEVFGANQIKHYCQLYCFQPHSTRFTESQGHIPLAKKPPTGAYDQSRNSPLGIAGSVSPTRGYSAGPVHSHHTNGGSRGVYQLPGGAHVLPENVGHDEKVRIVFDEIDTNKNRSGIRPDDWHRVFQVTGLELTSVAADDLFRKADFDKDGVVTFSEWQRFCELYPAFLDSLYYRLKAHWEKLAEAGRIDHMKAQRNGLEDRERAAQQALDAMAGEAADLEAKQRQADQDMQDAQDKQRAAEDAARRGMGDIDAARQARADKEAALQAEKEKERAAQQRAAQAGRERDEANRRAQAAQAALAQAENAEKRAMQALEDARREKDRQSALADAAKNDADAAQDRHNSILGDIPRTVEDAKDALARANKDHQDAEQRQHDLAQQSYDAQNRVAAAGRLNSDLMRQLQGLRDRQDPAQRSLSDAQQALADHDRAVSDAEDHLASEDARKRSLLDDEKSIVEQEIKLRAARESLEEQEGELREKHTNFFHQAGRESPGRSRSPNNYSTPTKY